MAQKENSDGFLHRWRPTHIMLVFPEDLMLVMIVIIFGRGENIDREGERERHHIHVHIS